LNKNRKQIPLGWKPNMNLLLGWSVSLSHTLKDMIKLPGGWKRTMKKITGGGEKEEITTEYQ
jgi:hypothetical protein